MILGVYGAQKAAGHEDRAWMTKAYQLATKDHNLWIAEPHLAGSTAWPVILILEMAPHQRVCRMKPVTTGRSWPTSWLILNKTATSW